jgi:outer membrane lipoprotein carrier protein
MKTIKFILTLFFFTVSAAVMAEPASEQLNDLLSHFNSMSAKFSQVSVKKGIIRKSSGTMALQRPGKFRWELTSPNHQMIIADGTYLWIYDVDLEQATKQSLTQNAHSPALLLSGSSAVLTKKFTIVDSTIHDNQAIFHLKPKRNENLIQLIELQFVDKKLSQMFVMDNLGQKNIFYFTQVKVNPRLSPSLFQFHPPRGVDVITSDNSNKR